MKSFCKNKEHEQIVRRLVQDAGDHVAGISFKGSSHIAVHVQLNRQHAEVIISCTSTDVNARHQVKANTRRLIPKMSAAENARIRVGPPLSERTPAPIMPRKGYDDK